MTMHCVVESSVSATHSECETSFVRRGTNEDEANMELLGVDSVSITQLDEAKQASSAIIIIKGDGL